MLVITRRARVRSGRDSSQPSTHWQDTFSRRFRWTISLFWGFFEFNSFLGLTEPKVFRRLQNRIGDRPTNIWNKRCNKKNWNKRCNKNCFKQTMQPWRKTGIWQKWLQPTQFGDTVLVISLKVVNLNLNDRWKLWKKEPKWEEMIDRRRLTNKKKHAAVNTLAC